MATDVKEVPSPSLPSPGDPEQSADTDLTRIMLVENCARCFLVAPILSAYALMEWLRWYRPLPPPPWAATVVTSVALMYSIYKVLTTWRVRKSLR